jgi:Mrp family chromosome partitioning ATPase
MIMQPSPEFQIRFLQNIQMTLKEGSFSSTYKFALLHSIADVCVEKGLDDDSLLPIHLAVQAHLQGLDTLLVDLDIVSRTASEWATIRQMNNQW